MIREGAALCAAPHSGNPNTATMIQHTPRQSAGESRALTMPCRSDRLAHGLAGPQPGLGRRAATAANRTAPGGLPGRAGRRAARISSRSNDTDDEPRGHLARRPCGYRAGPPITGQTAHYGTGRAEQPWGQTQQPWGQANSGHEAMPGRHTARPMPMTSDRMTTGIIRAGRRQRRPHPDAPNSRGR